MPRPRNLENLSFSELTALEGEVHRTLAAKRDQEKVALKQKMADLAKASGFDLREVFNVRLKAPVAVKYRDPENAGNTWTGRGRMPRWLTAATAKGGKTSKEAFAVK